MLLVIVSAHLRSQKASMNGNGSQDEACAAYAQVLADVNQQLIQRLNTDCANGWHRKEEIGVRVDSRHWGRRQLAPFDCPVPVHPHGSLSPAVSEPDPVVCWGPLAAKCMTAVANCATFQAYGLVVD